MDATTRTALTVADLQSQQNDLRERCRRHASLLFAAALVAVGFILGGGESGALTILERSLLVGLVAGGALPTMFAWMPCRDGDLYVLDWRVVDASGDYPCGHRYRGETIEDREVEALQVLTRRNVRTTAVLTAAHLVQPVLLVVLVALRVL